MKTGAGTLNLLEPRYSPFKVAVVQVRGQNAVVAQLAYMGMRVGLALVMAALRLLTWTIWLLWLALRFLWDLLRGMGQGFSETDT